MSGIRTTCRTGLRQPGITKIGLDNYHDTVHGHDFGGMSRVVMVRKTDQRIFASVKNGEEPKFETVTKETYETFRGNKTERKVTSIEKRGVCDKIPTELWENQSPGKSSSPAAGKSSTPKSKIASPTGKIASPNGKISSPASKISSPTSKMFQNKNFAAECLAAHNELRAKHGVPPLKLNKQISKASQDWADKLANRTTLSHSENREYGENIYSSWSSDPNYIISAKDLVQDWYSEIKDHNFDSEPTTLKSGHFTQVIWRESKELGVAFSRSKDGRFIGVANYYPPGNLVGHFTENVPPIGGFTSKSTSPKCFNGTSESNLKFEEECLKAHNEYRTLHGVEPLKLNKKMCKESQEWAKHLAVKGVAEHRKNIPYGENIYFCWSSNPSYTITGKDPVESWYSEIACHDFTKEPADLRSGHFTQVVWRTSKELGVGVEKNRNGQIFVVASYYPAGNYIRSFRENVLPKIVGAPQSKMVTMNCDTSPDDFTVQALKLHNEYRRKHGVPELKLNSSMCAYAQHWAEHLAVDGKLAHRPDSKYGENIFYMWSSDPSATVSAREVCKRWYDEIQDFTFGVESRMPKAGHFTQMIWKESTEFGIALAKGKNNGKTFVVANYNPKGNYIGKYLSNVPKPVK